MKLKIIIVFVFLPISFFASFKTLQQAMQYADLYQQSPLIDSDMWRDPDYSSYHLSIKESFLSRMMHFLPIKSGSKLIFDVDYFISLLNLVVNERISKRLKGDHIGGIIFDKPASIVLWGDVRGAFHSLVRDLKCLQDQGVINDDFEVIKPDCYLIFNGDVVGGAPYVLETLQLILLLLHKNPDNVFYLRGQMEHNNYWRNYNLAREVRIRMNFVAEQEVDILDKLTNFFSTLPVVIYITTTNDIHKALCISSSNVLNVNVNDPQLSFFVDKSPCNHILYETIGVQNKAEKITHILSIFKAEPMSTKSRVVFGEPKDIVGLGLLDQEYGANIWAMLSCPTPMYEKYYGFAYDSFAMLHIPLNLSESTIVLYNQNIHIMNGFKQHREINIISGSSQKLVQSQLEFGIGTTLGIGSGIPSLSKMVKRGIDTSVAKVNLTNELGDIWISLKIYDDSFLPYKARRNIEKMIADNEIEMVLSSTGAQNLSAYYDYIKDEKILNFFPITGDIVSRDSIYKGLIHLRASYAQEVDVLIEHVIKEYAAKKFLFFYENNLDGESALLMAHEALKSRGIKEWKDVACMPGAVDLQEQVDIIKKDQPDAIGFLSPPISIINLINQLGVDILSAKTLFAYSFANGALLRNTLDRLGLNCIFTSVVPNPATSQLDIVKRYRAVMDAYSYPYNVYSLETYITTNLLIDVVTKLEKPFGPLKMMAQKVKNTIEQFKDYSFGGFNLTFDPKTRSLLMPVWIEIKDGEWLQFDNAIAMNERILLFHKESKGDAPISAHNDAKVLVS